MPPKKTPAKRAAPAAAKRPAKKPATRKTTVKKAVKKAPAKETATKKGPAKKAPAKKAPAKKAPSRKAAFGRPGTAGKGEGDAAVRAWMQGVKAEHRPLVERLDALIGEVVPDVKRAVKWSSPMYGREGMGFFASFASFKEHVRLSFFSGVDLRPPPPEGESKGMRSVKLRDASDLDEKQLRSWIQQAAAMKGWGKV
jgi:hypothetical protein